MGQTGLRTWDFAYMNRRTSFIRLAVEEAVKKRGNMLSSALESTLLTC